MDKSNSILNLTFADDAEFKTKNVVSILDDLNPDKYAALALELGLNLTAVKKVEYGRPHDPNRVLIEIVDLWIKTVIKPKPSWTVLKQAVLKVQPGLVESIP